MFNDLFSSRARIDMLIDEGNTGVVVTASVKALRVNARTDLVIPGPARMVVDVSVGRINVVGIGMLTALGIVVVVAAAIALNVFETV